MRIHGIKLVFIIISHRLDRLFLPYLLAPSSWLMPFVISRKSRNRVAQNRGDRLANALESMGPVFIKFGQVLSMRQDVFPDYIVKSMARLQDNVTPYSSKVARQQIEQDLGCKLEQVFAYFDNEPVAAASIAQVHAAKLISGEDVVVKILRPKIRTAVARDIKLLFKVAKFLTFIIKNSQRLNLVAVVQELENQLHDELNLRYEAANASAFKSNFPEDKPLKVPKIYWDFVTKNIMVAERVYGVTVADVALLKQQGVNCQYLAELGLNLFFQQVFENNFFHADLHGGNIFIDITDKDKPSYVCVDFGIMGALDAKDKYYIAENLLAFFNRDYRRIAKLHIDSGWVPKNVRIDQFESAIRAVSEPIFALPLAQISFGKLLASLLVTVRRFDVEIQPQLILLQKTLLNVEALSRILHPDLDLWTTVKPYLENWTKSELGLRGFTSKSKEKLPFLFNKGGDFPELVYNFLEQATIDNVKLKNNHKQNTILWSFLLGCIFSLAVLTLGIWFLCNLK